jgi:hypothetical protein
MRHFAMLAVSCGEAHDLICFAPLDIKHEPLLCFQRDRGANAGRLCCRRGIQAFAMLTRRVGGVAVATDWSWFFCPVRAFRSFRLPSSCCISSTGERS